jgi:hypothetical protein
MDRETELARFPPVVAVPALTRVPPTASGPPDWDGEEPQLADIVPTTARSRTFALRMIGHSPYRRDQEPSVVVD